ncbi:MFS transporter [Umezakia ovalisporum]|uniref:MFS transporter n=2 Tax=Umezakia ovalisporum TaxID=75695 RepID=A0AA43GWA1_9CYAN|nr:MFS transporter [Umezakia ovalisporum]MBI1241712.1 MFS transporter [Nostoc sp. RI_552]MDH6055780.1 MFS transporter [Umezakia ovalisporum FSS-43]MDH6062312.1 MFS transporter [Umezakia ovalisporum FSS-62]MDH6067910.1 MFS transporter [Umezakia ovalisporum APH033B]MDH6071104.1 MFS transporter [Umezakia ovalisporum CobakiLakeA]
MNDSVDEFSRINPENQKLDLKTKIAYGAGDLGPAITANISIFFLLVFFTNVAGIPAGLAGSILMIGKIWDAINDPIIGLLSDRTQSRRWGRRLPWLFYGAIPFGLVFFLQWIVPRFSAEASSNIWPLFWYYVAIGLLSQVFYTVVSLPYAAMTPELTENYDERTSLNSFRFAFSIGGSILSLILAQIIFARISDREQQYLVLAAICAVISVLALYACIFGLRDRVLAFEAKRTQVEEPPSIPFLEQIKIVFSNRPYLFVIGIYLFSWLGVQVTATTIPYVVVNYMRLKESDVPSVMIAVQGTALLMLFVWSALSKKIGKTVVYFAGMSLWIIAAGGLFLLQPGQIALMYLLAVMAGFGVSTAYLVPWSLIPDVIDLDELQTGQRREGIFYGFMVLLQKLGLALGIFLVGNALETAGFQPAIPGETTLPIQPDSALLAIRITVGPLPIIFLICGLLLMYFYPITREIHTEIMMKLKARRENRRV